MAQVDYDRLDLDNAASLLSGLNDWAVEFYIGNYSGPITDDVSTFSIAKAIGERLSLVFNPVETTLTLSNIGTVVQGTFDTITSGTIRIESTAVGHSVYKDGSPVSITYTTGNASTPLLLPSGLVGISFSFLTATISSFIIESASSVVASFPLNEGSGSTVYDIVGGLTGDLQGSWIQDPSQNALTFISPFDRLDIPNSATDEERALYRTVDTDLPIIQSSGTGWTSIGFDNIKRNENCWYNSKPITSFSVYSDDSDYAFPATLLSPRHVLLANHVSTPIGTEYMWIDLFGNRQRTTLLDKESVSGDVDVGILADDIVIDVDYATFLPEESISSENAFRNFTTCGPSREGIMSIERSEDYGGVYITRGDGDRFLEWNWSRFSYTETPRTGDSQRPNFIYHGEKLFIMFVNHTSDALLNALRGGALSNSTIRGLIQDSMDSLDATHSRSPKYSIVIGEL
jgi:hypothetical protein